MGRSASNQRYLPPCVISTQSKHLTQANISTQNKQGTVLDDETFTLLQYNDQVSSTVTFLLHCRVAPRANGELRPNFVIIMVDDMDTKESVALGIRTSGRQK